MLVLPDNGDQYERKADLFTYIREMPVTWDESRVLKGEPGGYIVVARRTGKEWFVGANTNEEPRTIEIALDLNENTLFIFTAVNGADWREMDKERYGHMANYIYRGKKADIYEAGHRIPFIAMWDGVIPAGHQSDQLMCTTDLLASLAGLSGNDLPNDSGEDSYNLWPAFIGHVESPIRESVIHHSLQGFYSM